MRAERSPHPSGTLLVDRISHSDAASLLVTYGADLNASSNTMPLPLGMQLALDLAVQPMHWTLSISPVYHDYAAIRRKILSLPKLQVRIVD